MSATARFTQVQRPRILREKVLDQLRTSIVTGELKEGDLVSAPALGMELGVSATPVREAMMDLAREGLVETVKNKGFRITVMSEKDLDDLATIRLFLEPPAVHLLIGNVPDSSFLRLTELADQCMDGAERGNLVKYINNDREFHHLLLTYTNNPQLAELSTSLRIRTRMYGLKALSAAGRLTESAKEHHQLIRLVREGNAGAAEDLLREHIGHTRTIWATGPPDIELT